MAENAHATPVVLDAEFIQDRHTLYETLRRESPVREAIMPDGLRVWLVTRYADARAALADPALSKDSRRAAPLHRKREAEEGTERMEFSDVLVSHMLNLDPPDHTRLRKLVSKAFTLRRVELLRPTVETVAKGLLSRLDGRDRVDLLADYAFPLSLTVSGDLFGVPREERELFQKLSNDVAFPRDAAAMGPASFAIADYLTDLVARKRAEPQDDLVTALVQARDDHDRLSEHELVAMTFLLLTAGYETTGHLIGNGILALLQNPDQLAALRADPSLLPGAVEEFLRFDGPTGTTTLRFTTEPTTIGGVDIPAGDFVLIPLGSTNRDEDRFPDADRLDITRDTRGHLAFGHGIHYCAGAPLGRMEGQVAIGGLLEHFPDLRLAVPVSDLRWRNTTLFRGLEELPVQLVS